MSMATKSSDLVDKMYGANLQVDGHMEVPTQSVKDPWELEEEDSSPSCLPSWSSVRRLLTLPSSYLLFKFLVLVKF